MVINTAGNCCPHNHDKDSSSCEMLVTTYRIIQSCNSTDYNRTFHCCENFVSHQFQFILFAISLTFAVTGELDMEGSGLSSPAFSPWSSAELESSPQ
jgi:hypothetical protein